MTPLSKEAKKLLMEVRQCDGAEVHQDDWPLAEELREAGLIDLGSARGPARAWKRAEVADVQ